MEPDEDSNAHWLYRRCSTARTTMQTPLSALHLSIKVLRFIKSIDEDADDISQMELFNVLKNQGQAKKRDLSFVFELCERAIELRDDEEFSEESLRAIAASSGDGDETASYEIGAAQRRLIFGVVADEADGENNATGDNSADGENISTDAATTSVRAQSGEERLTSECTSAAVNNVDDDPNRHMNFDELHCFQLRTRVLGLNMPTFSELWRYLQTAGWTYSSAKYHIPKGRKVGMKWDMEDMAKRIYKHFNLDNTCNLYGTEQSDVEELNNEEEEGPEIFDNPNDLVDYLDEFCMPDYRATPAEIRVQDAALSLKPKAYKRRNKRLRFELLEVAYRERTRKSAVDQEQHDDISPKSKYGHNHRPCEVCFKGTNHLYPRVACRECGLVVHTHCYGLLDHGEEKDSSNNNSRSTFDSARKGANVDDKGFFTCDVCANNIMSTKQRRKCWNTTQSSGWRVHEHPNAVCPLCDKKHITGAMIRIVVKEEGRTGIPAKKNRKRKSRRSADSSETWAHLFCINSLPSITTAPSSIRSSDTAVLRIGDALDSATEIVRETESMRETTIKCLTCTKQKGDLIQCKGTCGSFFHRLCLQIDCLDIVGWNTKKEHLCLSCRNIDGESSPDHNEAAISSGGPAKVNDRQGNSSKEEASQVKHAEEVDQYFDRKKYGKKSLKSEVASSDLVVPSQQDCIAEVESLHCQSNADHAIDEFEAQYQQQFYEWSFSMATNQSILLYGLGSKTSVLTSFGKYLAREGDVVSLNGYDPNIDLNQFLEYIDQLFCDGSESKSNPQPNAGKKVSLRVSNKGLAKKAASIAKTFASTRSRPLFILIHNIDGVGLRNRFAQDAIAILTSNSGKDHTPLIRVAASVDNVNAAMVLWSPQVEHKFDWAWKKVHTYRPYFEEVRCLPHAESSEKEMKRIISQKHGAGSAVLKVLAYLAPKHTQVLQVLANLQLSSSSYTVSYSAFRDACITKMLTSSDTNLRNILKELFDHNIVASEKDEKGSELIFVPSRVPIHDILNFER
eukprot:CAMPEP_0172313678 /NCGR_PEP_ID=MMETSP1058-20130122/20750_1 /TAXON_ID=83371 /ORGANISM="Detonula confervacea, Strain CCMP 353" /LENGTH=1016 /DNA_ID=CAMNT_0013027375 /DNA_START=84 /DNA_END=3134 /DNA_ORIENTATION=+